AMLDHTCLPCNLWGEAALCAAYLFNCTESCSLDPGKTPYEMLHGVKPDIAHLQVFSTHCFVHIPAELQKKLGLRSHEAVFMGY
ncbi:copia protein, partial [Suillus decipiens]